MPFTPLTLTRGNRELNYKFTNNVNITKPSKAPPPTNNPINNNRETPTINTPQPLENTIVDTNTQNQVTNNVNTDPQIQTTHRKSTPIIIA